MQWHDFVFSKKTAYQLLRHSAFWMAWWLYFSFCQYLYQQPTPTGSQPSYVLVGSHIFIKTFLLMVIYAIACYTFIYFLLPQLIQAKWLRAIPIIIVLSALLFSAAWFIYWNLFPFIDSLFGPYKPNIFATKFWPAVSLGLIDPLKVVAAAGIIKYVKYTWLKQKESERLEREKINAELQLLKAQIHPGFLFNALNNVYDYSLVVSPRAPEMLLELSDLLSYMLYECDEPFVALEKEIAMMKDYIALEKIRLNDAIEMEVSVTGNMSEKIIAPFLLLPFIENSFKQSIELTEKAWINMDISIEEDSFSMKLAYSIHSEVNKGQAVSENGLANVQKRLCLIYPDKHVLKISREREMLIVLLKIQLADTIPSEMEEDVNLVETELEIAQPNMYAAQ